MLEYMLLNFGFNYIIYYERMSMYENYKPTIINYSSFDEVPIEERDKLKECYSKTLKEKRNLILQETDKYLLPDYPIILDKLDMIKEYRQIKLTKTIITRFYKK